MGASSPVNPLSNENKCHRLEHMQAQAGTSWIMHRSALNGKRHETWQDDKNEQCYPGPQVPLNNTRGQEGSTVDHPTLVPLSIKLRDGQSAGLASVDIRSIKIRARKLSARSQKMEMSKQMSSRDEYPLIKAPSTASESIRRIISAPLTRSAKV